MFYFSFSFLFVEGGDLSALSFFLFLLGQISDLSSFSSFFFLCVEGGSAVKGEGVVVNIGSECFS